MKKLILVGVFMLLMAAIWISCGREPMVVHSPSSVDLAEINTLNKALDDEFSFPQNVDITFTIQEDPRSKSLSVYHLSHDLRYSPTAGLCIVLWGQKESRFKDVSNRICSIINAQGIKTFKVRRTSDKFFIEEVIFLQCDLISLRHKEWMQVWKKIFMEYSRFFYNIKIENIKTIQISNPRKFIPFKNVLPA